MRIVLEIVLDHLTLHQVIDHVIEACTFKTLIIRHNWEDTGSAPDWQRAAGLLAKARDRMHGDGISANPDLHERRPDGEPLPPPRKAPTRTRRAGKS